MAMMSVINGERSRMVAPFSAMRAGGDEHLHRTAVLVSKLDLVIALTWRREW